MINGKRHTLAFGFGMWFNRGMAYDSGGHGIMSCLNYPCMMTGEYFEGLQIAEGAEFLMEHPVEPSWAFYKLTNADSWGTGSLACFVNIDVEHAKEHQEHG